LAAYASLSTLLSTIRVLFLWGQHLMVDIWRLWCCWYTGSSNIDGEWWFQGGYDPHMKMRCCGSARGRFMHHINTEHTHTVPLPVTPWWTSEVVVLLYTVAVTSMGNGGSEGGYGCPPHMKRGASHLGLLYASLSSLEAITQRPLPVWGQHSWWTSEVVVLLVLP
jgi:hypothetical protein